MKAFVCAGAELFIATSVMRSAANRAGYDIIALFKKLPANGAFLVII